MDLNNSRCKSFRLFVKPIGNNYTKSSFSPVDGTMPVILEENTEVFANWQGILHWILRENNHQRFSKNGRQCLK